MSPVPSTPTSLTEDGITACTFLVNRGKIFFLFYTFYSLINLAIVFLFLAVIFGPFDSEASFQTSNFPLDPQVTQ